MLLSESCLGFRKGYMMCLETVEEPRLEFTVPGAQAAKLCHPADVSAPFL